MFGNSPSAPALSGFAFAGNTLDRADGLRDDADALIRLWPQARVLLIDAEGNAGVDGAGRLLAPTGAELGGGPGTAIFLGLKDATAWFAINAANVAFTAPESIDLRRAAAVWSDFEAGVFAMARALLHWQSRTRYCGVSRGDIGCVRAG